MRELRGTMTEEDYIEFNIYHMNNSKSYAKLFFVLRLLFPIIFIMFGMIIGRLSDFIFWIILVIISIVWYVIAPKILENSMGRRIKKMLKDKSNGDLFLEKKYVFNDELISVESTNTSNQYKSGSVVSIAESESSFYLYISSIQAIVVPKRIIGDMSKVEEFRKMIRIYA